MKRTFTGIPLNRLANLIQPKLYKAYKKKKNNARNYLEETFCYQIDVYVPPQPSDHYHKK